jgi:hypothetical protein
LLYAKQAAVFRTSTLKRARAGYILSIQVAISQIYHN